MWMTNRSRTSHATAYMVGTRRPSQNQHKSKYVSVRPHTGSSSREHNHECDYKGGKSVLSTPLGGGGGGWKLLNTYVNYCSGNCEISKWRVPAIYVFKYFIVVLHPRHLKRNSHSAEETSVRSGAIFRLTNVHAFNHKTVGEIWKSNLCQWWGNMEMRRIWQKPVVRRGDPHVVHNELIISGCANITCCGGMKVLQLFYANILYRSPFRSHPQKRNNKRSAHFIH